jgi:hypothetical protein
MGDLRNAFKILVEKPERIRQFGKSQYVEGRIILK